MSRKDDLRQKHRAELKELSQAYLAAQEKYEAQGAIPKDSDAVLSGYRQVWEIMGAAHLGLLVAIISILLNFIVVNIIFHLPPS